MKSQIVLSILFAACSVMAAPIGTQVNELACSMDGDMACAGVVEKREELNELGCSVDGDMACAGVVE